MKEVSILAIIPARGGSKGIPKKNIRLMAGKPLIYYCITNAINSNYNMDVVVSTDDEEIERIAISYGADVQKRPIDLAGDSITLDPVINYAVTEYERKKGMSYDVVITMQPTSPLLTVYTLDNAINYFLKNNYDSVISVVNNPHLAWKENNNKFSPLYEKRLNRQELPKHFSETGAFFISRRDCVKAEGRLGNNISVFEVPEKEAVDIDSPQDWWIAEKELTKKNILIRVEGYNEIGTGHIQRELMLANNLIDHNVKFVLSSKSDIGIKKIRDSYYNFCIIDNNDDIIKIIDDFHCDILINDILNTSEDYIKLCKSTGVKVVNFEDLGEGGKYADIVINDLYEKQFDNKNYYWGSDYYCLRDEFVFAKPSKYNEIAKEVLISFGGTDPSNLTLKVFEAIKDVLNECDVHFTFILGLGYKYKDEFIENSKEFSDKVDIVTNVIRMSDYMSRADLAVCSQGRTMLELAAMAVPTIILAQNEREQEHEFGYIKNGFLNLGLGCDVQTQTIVETLVWLINTPQIRKQIKQQMLKKNFKKGIERVKKIILNSEEI